MKAISICSGMDGFGYAANLLGVQVTAHIELDPVFDEHYKRHWPNALRFYDLKTTDPNELPSVDIVFGGEPCQGNSVAGERKGIEDDRFLWPDYFRICAAKRPRWIINENVVGSISNLVLDRKITDLENEGYTCQTYNIPACAIGALNERQRIWLVAYTDGQRLHYNENSVRFQRPNTSFAKSLQESFGKESKHKIARVFSSEIQSFDYPGKLCSSDDVSTQLAEFKAYGNAVNPWIPYVLLKFILEIDQQLSN